MVAAVTGGPAVCVRRDGQEPRVRPPAQLVPTDRVAAGGVGVSMTPPAPLPTAGVTARKAGSAVTAAGPAPQVCTEGNVGMFVPVRTTPRVTTWTEPAPACHPGLIATPLILTLLVAALVLFIFYRRKKARQAENENNVEETMVVLELRNMEEDLAQGLQPGWLHRWERNADDLTLDELVGLGASAQIRRGRLRTAGADVTVAVKSVRIEDRRCYRAFCREVAALVAVHENSEEENGGHPNIVKLFGVVTMSSPKCILLEFAAKGELLLILKQPRQNRPLGRFVRYAVQISCALDELRRLRIAHGDVAARNVLVSGDDVAKLADFGLAHDVYTETTYVSADNDDVDELLPLKWMALESLESREFTCESDTWSFGVLLWEIAAFGEEPSYQHQRQQSCPKLVGLLRQGVRLDRPPGCPDKLYDVMKSCWREEPSARPEPAELEQRLTECGHELDLVHN
uniref:Protein kinase domain-containing protein n=1 Tax=Branchiostoma floridae TaxID=7739 RepID=C3ZRJ9_BRAFL|eukprot:XP_002588788.1 hypothetical protein BRAFLDRAFT_89782 [Branchiostoma floridae]